MPGKSSAAKRHRQSEARRMRNRVVKSTVRTAKKKFLLAVQAKDKEKAQEEFKTVVSLFDSAGRKGVFHKNTADRNKSRMHILLNKMNTES